MSTIPGAEYAPIIAIIGGRYQQPSEGAEQQFRSAEAVLHGTTLKTMGGHVRRLSYSAPDDPRALWRRAALALGATEEEAMTAVLRADVIGCINLQTYDSRGSERSRFATTTRWSTPRGTWVGDGEDLKRATAALCAKIWGPR